MYFVCIWYEWKTKISICADWQGSTAIQQCANTCTSCTDYIPTSIVQNNMIYSWKTAPRLFVFARCYDKYQFRTVQKMFYSSRQTNRLSSIKMEEHKHDYERANTNASNLVNASHICLVRLCVCARESYFSIISNMW